MKKILIIVLSLALLLALTACAGPALVNADGSDTVAGVALKTALDVLEAAVVTVLGVAATAWAAKNGDKAKMEHICLAMDNVMTLARQTVGELNQTLVNGLKEAAPDGKLSEAEKAALQQKLLEQTLQKLDRPTKELLESAGVDLCAIITGAGEEYIGRLHKK